ncbi:MAG: CaiB/BaiF CoA-transferase family protein [Bacteroidota bacterium]
MGPLAGIKIIEMVGLGPGPFAGMLLADMGADVVQVERKSGGMMPAFNRRGKRSIALNLKEAKDVELLLQLVEKADALFEGFRPGVMEKFGVGPDVLLARNPKLVIGRMTGWGQTGPLAHAAGHDINYISLTGVLKAIGRKGDKPSIPLNIVGDYGGGAMFLVMGLLAALLEAQKSGKGQVIDVAMTDGSAMLMSLFHSLHSIGLWSTHQGQNMLDGGAHFYDVYETQDGKYVSIGSIEPQFYMLLMQKMELPPAFSAHMNAQKWPELKDQLTAIFKTKTRDEWCELMAGTDVCFAPVLDYMEAQQHPHNVARNTYIEVDGETQPAPAPKFSRTVSEVQHGAHKAGADREEVLRDWGVES